MPAGRLRVPLQAPDVGQMPELERRMALVEPALAQAAARLEVAQRRWRAALDADDLDVQERERSRVQAEGAYAAWAALARPAADLREEWVQLQVVRAFMPICAGCGEAAGAVHLQLAVEILCLGCLDRACGHDPRSRRRPPSERLGRLASEARWRETNRRISSQNARGDDQVREPRCWYCSGALADAVAVQVVATAPGGSQPEVGALCLECVERELRPPPAWTALQRALGEGVR